MVGPGIAFNIGIIDIFVDYMFTIALPNTITLETLGAAAAMSTSHTFHLGVRLNI